MTRTELNQFFMILNAKQAELARAMGKRDSITIERTPDALDETQSAAERELSTRNLERQSEILRKVHAALHRIDSGTYGTCLDCDEEISHKRLDAMPWATLCIQCQESADGNHKRSFASEGNSLKKAA